MNEKGLYVDLPKKENCREVKVAKKVIIPKPERLIGGTEVYQKEGLPYWFCRIKNGRDEFMHLYTQDLTRNDVLYDDFNEKWRSYSTYNAWKFKEELLVCVEQKPENGFVWIPVYEPSSDGKGGIQYVRDQNPLTGLSCIDWEKVLEEYSPENQSGMALKSTGFLLLLRWLKDEIVDIMQLAEDSYEIGNYAKRGKEVSMELTGTRPFGGLDGFVGNTEKLMREFDLSDKRRTFYQTSGSYLSFSNAVGRIHLASSYDFPYDDAVGFMELKK